MIPSATPLAAGAPSPGGRVRTLDEAPAALPESGTIVFLDQAFSAPGRDACEALPSDSWVVLAEAPVVAAAWLRSFGAARVVVCDDQPRGAVAASWGVLPTEGRVGWSFRVAGGVITTSSPILAPAQPSAHERTHTLPTATTAAPAAPASNVTTPGPSGSGGWQRGWGPGVLATGLVFGAGLLLVGLLPRDGSPAKPDVVTRSPVTQVAAPAPTGPLPSIDRPRVSALVENTSALAVPNLDLAADSGTNLGFGEAVAGDGHPDGWHTNARQGDVKVSAAGAGVRFTYGPETKVAFASQPQAVAGGDSVEVRFTLDAESSRSHPAQVGVAFFTGRAYLEQATRSIEVEGTGPQTMVVRATAPEAANKVQLRWNLETGGKSGSFAVSDVSFTRSHARSSARFPLQHVLLVTIETLRVDHTGLGGYARDTTPNLVKLASEGARFDRHYVQAPYTRPSLSSLVSGQYPAQTGVEDNVAMLPESAVTVAERFAENGYVTSAFLAQFLLNQNFGFNQGFHSFFNFKNDTPADQPYARLTSWLEAHEGDNTFSWVHLFDPHGPYRPPAEVQDSFRGDALWSADTRTVPPGKGAQRGKVIPDYVYDDGENERRHYVARYDADILYADRIVGQLVDWLRARGLENDTLLVVTADHGESMTDHEKYFAHGSLWENDIHVPLVVWAPGRVPGGQVVSALTEHVDIVPTLLDYAGITTDALPGRSLRGPIEGTTPPRAFTLTNGADKGIRHEAIVSPTGLKVVLSEAGELERAYDVLTDPAEANDVAKARAAEAEALALAYRTSAQAAAPVKTAPSREVGADEKAKLEALGYIDGEGAP